MLLLGDCPSTYWLYGLDEFGVRFMEKYTLDR